MILQIDTIFISRKVETDLDMRRKKLLIVASIFAIGRCAASTLTIHASVLQFYNRKYNFYE